MSSTFGARPVATSISSAELLGRPALGPDDDADAVLADLDRGDVEAGLVITGCRAA